MALKNYKPNTPGLRQKTTLVKSEVTAQKPEKSLTISLHQKSGRDTFGRISVRRRGGGVKRAYSAKSSQACWRAMTRWASCRRAAEKA